MRAVDGSFSENFYGLKRVSTSSSSRSSSFSTSSSLKTTSSSQKFTHSKRLKSLFFLVAVPYIKSKLDALYSARGSLSDVEQAFNNELDDENYSDSQRNNQSLLSNTSTATAPTSRLQRFRNSLESILHKLYPSLNVAYYASQFIFQILFLLGRTPYFSPWLYLSGIKIQRLTQKDHVSNGGDWMGLDVERERETAKKKKARYVSPLLTHFPSTPFHHIIQQQQQSIYNSLENSNRKTHRIATFP